ncbi:MAG TPA: M48 family metallopeptidase [Bellilinea sp.]|nr:M48 family metallopeptidase [Bellilinea sp.]
MRITVQKQPRRSLVFKLTPSGALVLVPEHLDKDSPVVQDFIRTSLAALPQTERRSEPLPIEEIHRLVREWCQRLEVQVSRTQIRKMRNKWGSISTAGTLTLADDLLFLPRELIEYAIVHELLHLLFPDHRRGWRVSISMYLPDWQEREQRLQGTLVEAVNLGVE